MPSRWACPTNRRSTTRTRRSGPAPGPRPPTAEAAAGRAVQGGRSAAAATSRCPARWPCAARSAAAGPAGAVAERGEQHPVARRRSPDRLDGRVDRRVGLQVDVEPDLGPGVEQSSSRGTAAAPPIAHRARSAQGRSSIRPGRPSMRSRVVVVERPPAPRRRWRARRSPGSGSPASTARAKPPSSSRRRRRRRPGGRTRAAWARPGSRVGSTRDAVCPPLVERGWPAGENQARGTGCHAHLADLALSVVDTRGTFFMSGQQVQDRERVGRVRSAPVGLVAVVAQQVQQFGVAGAVGAGERGGQLVDSDRVRSLHLDRPYRDAIGAVQGD